jgi:hypothetical protein
MASKTLTKGWSAPSLPTQKSEASLRKRARYAEISQRIAYQDALQQPWVDGFSTTFSKDNQLYHKNLRSYFDRNRDAYDYTECTPKASLIPSWQINTPTGEAPFRPIIVTPRLERTLSLEAPRTIARWSPKPWNQRHNVMFSKDNERYNKGLRHYFDAPKQLLY